MRELEQFERALINFSIAGRSLDTFVPWVQKTPNSMQLTAALSCHYLYQLHKQTLTLPANALPRHRSTLSILAWNDPKRSQALASIVERIIEAEELRTVFGGDARKV
jgi:hypothetical protein